MSGGGTQNSFRKAITDTASDSLAKMSSDYKVCLGFIFSFINGSCVATC